MALASEVEAFLADGPRKRRDIIDALGIDSEIWNGVVNWVDLVRIPPSGTWEARRADLYGLAESWVGGNDTLPAVGRDLLVRRYLSGFGPASRGDIQAFTLLTLDDIDGSLSRLRTRRHTTRQGHELIDLSGAPIVTGDAAAPVRFIGNWDALLLVHARRAGILPEEHRTRIFHTKTPHSFATFIVDGRVRGTWREEDGRVVLDRFQPVPRRFERALTEERRRLEDFLR
jgi:hypothetical protein